MKRTNKVRLTEAQLNRVIKESVKQVLSELDWKTYANAARKASFGDYRFWDFMRKAGEEFNKKYGMSSTYNPEDGVGIIHADVGDIDGAEILRKGNEDFHLRGDSMWKYGDIPIHYTKRMSNVPVAEWDEDWVDDETGEISTIHRKQYDDRKFTSTPAYYDYVDDIGSTHHVDVDDEDDDITPNYNDITRLPNYKDLKQHYKDANDDFYHYMNGNYKYIKGKGWQLNNKNGLG